MLDAPIWSTKTRGHQFYFKRREWTKTHVDGCKISKITFITAQCYMNGANMNMRI